MEDDEFLADDPDEFADYYVDIEIQKWRAKMENCKIRLIHWSGKDVTDDHSVNICAPSSWPNLTGAIKWLWRKWPEIVASQEYMRQKEREIDNIPVDQGYHFYFDLARIIPLPMKIWQVDWGLHFEGEDPPARFAITARVIVTAEDVTIWAAGQDSHSWKVVEENDEGV